MSTIETTLSILRKDLEHHRQAIAALEQLQTIREGRGERRGRKSMGLEERKQVSERMRKYWADRRGKRQAR